MKITTMQPYDPELAVKIWELADGDYDDYFKDGFRITTVRDADYERRYQYIIPNWCQLSGKNQTLITLLLSPTIDIPEDQNT